MTPVQHCDDAPCIKNCKSKAIYKRDDGAVIIDPTRCTGQRNCLEACPYGVIQVMNSTNTWRSAAVTFEMRMLPKRP